MFARPANPGSFGKLPFAVRIGRQAFRLLYIMPGQPRRRPMPASERHSSPGQMTSGPSRPSG